MAERMAENVVHVDHLRVQDIERVAEIVGGLPEWFTPEAVGEVKRDARSMAGFAARINGIIRGFILLDERECCVEIAWLAV